MNTLSKLGYVALFLAAWSTLLPAETFAQGRFDDVEVVAHHVAGSVYYLASGPWPSLSSIETTAARSRAQSTHWRSWPD